MGFKLLRLTLAALLLTFTISLGSNYKNNYTNEELIEQSSTCLLCHEDFDQTLSGSVHRLLSEDDLPSKHGIGCISCHDGWEEHIDDPVNENITAGPEETGLIQGEICSRCHNTPHQAAIMTTDPHGRDGLNCSSCHSMHSNSNRFLAKDDSQNYCSECHIEVTAQFNSRSSHPLNSNNIRCTDCHSLGNIQEHDFSAGLDWNCGNCHTDVTGPFIYEHPVTYSHLVNGAGCTECHNPHGSPNDRLMKQSGENLCRQCHITPPGHRIAHSGLGSRHACIDCHSEIHGSNDNRLLLDPDLGVKMVVNCYQSGCHSQGY